MNWEIGFWIGAGETRGHAVRRLIFDDLAIFGAQKGRSMDDSSNIYIRIIHIAWAKICSIEIEMLRSNRVWLVRLKFS